MDIQQGPPDFDGAPKALSAWFTSPAEVTRWAREEPASLQRWLATNVGALSYRAIWDAEALDLAVADRSGKILFTSSSFPIAYAETVIDRESIALAASQSQPVVVPVIQDDRQIALVAYARIAVARGWHIPTEALAVAEQTPGAVVVLMTVPRRPKPLLSACEAYGLTDLQQRTVMAVMNTGSIKLAAARAGIAYVTARETMSDVFKRVGVRGTPGLIMQLSALAFGVLPLGGKANPLLTDIWGLTERQAAVAALIVEGHSRAEAGVLLGLSESVIKKEIERVFATLEITSAAALARTLSEAAALSLVMTVTGDTLGLKHPSAEPLRFVLRPDGLRIAISDYGPASATPCFIVHSSMTTRPVARRLVAELQKRGYRPIAIDRPGFGMTDDAADRAAPGHDPFAAAAADFVIVAQKLRLRRAAFVVRGAAPFILALDRIAPEFVGRVILVNPDIHTDAAGRRHGPLGAFKEAYTRNTQIITMMARLLAANINFDRVQAMLSRSMAGSPPDEAALRDPQIAEDMFRAGRMFATGRVSGYIAEQTWFARAGTPVSLPARYDWHVVLGGHDTLHNPAEVESHWRRLLPDSSFETVQDAGRLLALTHADLVASRL